MSALDIQIGGEHYKTAKIQPIQYIEANDLGFLEGCVVKRITRHDKPTGKGRQDIEKAIHELQLLLEFRYPQAQSAPRFDPASPGTADALKLSTAVHAWLAERPETHTMTNPPGEDIYAEFAARLGAAPTIVLPATPTACPECGYPTDAAGTHYATCSQLTAPEEYKAEAQVAFDEAAEISDTLARQVSAGKIDTDSDEATHEDVPAKHCPMCGVPQDTPHRTDCPVLRRNESRLLADMLSALPGAVEPAAAMDDDSPRMQAIGQNGNEGEHYDDPFADAPKWARWKAQQEHGAWEFYEDEPTNERGFWRHELRGVRSGGVGAPNPNWRDTLITRT